MRRAMIITILLLVLTIGGTCFAAASVYEAHDQVTLTEQIAWGDRSAAEGLKVQLSSTYEERLRWTTSLPLAKPDEVETEYDFSATRVYADTEPFYNGVTLENDFGSSFTLEQMEQENAKGLARAYQELAETVGPGEDKEIEIYLKDYVDYYPLNIMLDLPGTYLHLESGSLEAEGAQDMGTEPYVAWKIQEFFRIPVLEEERQMISLGKNEKGNVHHWGSGSGNSDSYYMWTHSVVTEEACYFTINSHSSSGVVMDMSEIPGGYGIYRLPYEEERFHKDYRKICGADADGLQMVYSLDPETEVLTLHTDHAQERLLLHGVENGRYVLTVIDLATMKTLQKLDIMEYAEYDSYIYNKEDYIVTFVDGREFLEAVVLAENLAGEYEIAFSCNVGNEEIPSFQIYDLALDFDGERLALSGFLEDEKMGYRQTCSIFLAVYDASGIRYYGEFKNSLDTGRDAENYSFHCRDYGAEPIVLRWE